MITELFKNHGEKDINHNFVDALTAIIFLSPPTKSDFTKLFNVSIGRQLYQYNIYDYLVRKLYDNTRRLYPYVKTEAKKTTFNYLIRSDLNNDFDYKNKDNFNDLINQQNNIYKLFNLLKDSLFFDDNEYDYKLLGSSRYDIKSTDMFVYLTIHQSLQPQNYDTHRNILSIMHNAGKVDESFILNSMNSVLINKKQADNLKFIFSFVKPENLIEEVSTHNYTWLITAIEYMFAENKILSPDSKIKLMRKIANTKLFDLFIFNDFVKDKELYKNDLKIWLEQDNLSDEINKNVNSLIVSSLIKSTETYQYLFGLIKVLDNIEFLINTIDGNVDNDIKNIILSHYYIDNKLIQDTLEYKHINSKTINPKETLKELLQLSSEDISKETLSLILISDPNYIDVIKPLYNQMLLNDSIPLKEMPTVVKKSKL